MRNLKTRTQKQSFLEGALILIAANILIKLIGALFKIPLKNLIGADGMGIYNTAYTPYAFLLTLSTVGIPVAVSRMTAQAEALGRERELRRIFGVSVGLSAAVGGVLSVILLLAARPFTEAIPNTRALYAVMMFAPALLFASIVSAFRGFYQGLSNMVPTALSQLVESVSRLLLGYTLAYLAISRGSSVETAAAAAILGVSLSTLLSLFYLLIREKLRGTVKKLPGSREGKRRNIARTLSRIAFPITLASGLTSLTGFIDMFVIQNRLQIIGYTEQGASTLYGIYETMCVSLINLPQTLVAAVTVSLIPMLSASLAQHDVVRSRRAVDSALRLTAFMAFPCTVAFLALPEPLLMLLFREDTAEAAGLLRILAPATVFISFVSVTNAILQAAGKERLSLYSMLIGSIVKLVVNYILVGSPEFGIAGAPISTVICYTVILILNLIFLLRMPEAAPKKWLSILKPGLAAVLMGVFIYLLYPWLSAGIGPKVAVILMMILGAVFYGAALLTLHGIYREDVLMFPKGEKIANFLKLSKENEI